MRRFCGGLLVISLVMLSAEAQASQVESLIRMLKQSSSYKVRLTAVLGLSKYLEPASLQALRSTLENRREHPYVRAFAALGLARMKDVYSLRAIKRAARARNRFLRKKARKALRMMCPRRLRRKKFYIDLSKIRSSGPLHRYARDLMLLDMYQILRKRRDVTTTWPRCRQPRRWMLRRKRMSGYYIRMNLKLKYAGGKIQSSLNLLFTTYPQDSIKGAVSANAAANTSPNVGIVTRLIHVLTKSLARDISYFLDSR